MKRFTILLICGLIPSLLAQCTVKNAERKFKRSVYDFSSDLLTRIAEEKDGHFVTSTLSAWILLVSMSLGAEDTTLAEFKQVLRLGNKKCFNNKYLQIASAITPGNETEVVLERASALFVDTQFDVSFDFRDKIEKNGISKFESISFQNPETAAVTVNDYVSRATHGMIDGIVSSVDLEDVPLLMIDAIYFNGPWRFPFASEDTKIKPFFNDRGVPIGEVNLMDLIGSFKVINLDSVKARVTELPYGKDDRYSMLLFLPLPSVPVSTVIEKLKSISLSTIRKQFDKVVEQMVNVKLPRFKITSDLSNLRELLADMGLRTMFDSSLARFPLISDYPLYVANFVQKADIEVTEKGAVASAATEAGFSFRSLPAEFFINKPFVFMIIDKTVEVPLFTGAYSKPSLF